MIAQMSDQVSIYPNELALIIENSSKAFQLEDRKTIQHIILTIVFHSEQTTLKF
jgi:hypothetical protein